MTKKTKQSEVEQVEQVDTPKVEPTVCELFGQKIEELNQTLPAVKESADLQKIGQSVLNLSIALSYYAVCGDSTELDKEIALLLRKVRSPLKPIDIQQVTQAVLHYVQAKSHLQAIGKPIDTKLGTSAE